MATLRRYLARKPELVTELDPRKFEELLRSVFSDFFACEVHHIGGPHDQGVDLVVVLRDEPFVVQVKRRASARAEPVSTVRHFLGAMLLKGEKRGSIVTTAARRFSTSARDAAGRAVTMRLVEQLELVDLRRICEILGVVGGASYQRVEPWSIYLREVVHPRPREAAAVDSVRKIVRDMIRLKRDPIPMAKAVDVE